MGQALLNDQISIYKRILDSLGLVDTLEPVEQLPVLIELLEMYFTVFLPFHSAYDLIALEIRDLLASLVGVPLALQVINNTLVPNIVEWQAISGTALDNRKNLLMLGEILHLPPHLSFEEDLHHAETRADGVGDSAGIDDAVRERLKYASMVFTVKEWKFVINKLLYSRFSHAFRSLCDGSPDIWRQWPIEYFIRSVNSDQ